MAAGQKGSRAASAFLRSAAAGAGDRMGRCPGKVDRMKGFVTAAGFMGLVEGHYILFASEADYLEYMQD